MSFKIKKWVILVAILILPFLLYYIWVYNVKEIFFQSLEYAGPAEITEDGDTIPYTIPAFDGYLNQNGTSIDRSFFDGKITVVNFFLPPVPAFVDPCIFN